MTANNVAIVVKDEAVVLQPISQLTEIAHRHCELLQCDTVQGFREDRLDLAALGVDLFS
ncbi:aminotransferase class V-fold PLP-dependent enzyme [Nocardia sp. NPDC004711]